MSEAMSHDTSALDPMNQDFTIYDSRGEEVVVNMNLVAQYSHNYTIQAIVSASQIGALAVILIMLLILTKPEKRRSPVFSLNVLALLFSIISQVLICQYYTNSWTYPYTLWTRDPTFVTSTAKSTSIAAGIFTIFVVITLEISLVLQIHVVSITLTSVQRLSLIILSSFIAGLAISFRIIQTARNISFNILQLASDPNGKWLSQARDITLTISICFFSAIFTIKLFHSLYQRRKLGLEAFGPMQILFIGGLQTMFLPAIFAIIQFAAPTTRINSFVLTITAICLPLTSLWASAKTDRPVRSATHGEWYLGGSGNSKGSDSKSYPMYNSGGELSLVTAKTFDEKV